MDYHEEGILMAPARGIPRLLARHKLRFADIQSWNIHEAFARQVLANIKAASDPSIAARRLASISILANFRGIASIPHGGSLAIGHPFAATGARILSQAAKELGAMAAGLTRHGFGLRGWRPWYSRASGAQLTARIFKRLTAWRGENRK